MTPHRRSVLLVGVIAALAIAIPVMGADPPPSAGPSASSDASPSGAPSTTPDASSSAGPSELVDTVDRVGAARRDTGDGDASATRPDARPSG